MSLVASQFEWLPELSVASWLDPMCDAPFGSLYSTVPHGYARYARIFHPVQRDRPTATKSWLTVDEATYFDDVDDIDALLETQTAAWGHVAASYATVLHPEAQFSALCRATGDDSSSGIAPDGWRYHEPEIGNFQASSLAILSQTLAQHTGTPADGVAGIWEGWGGLTSSAGFARFEAYSPFTALKMKLSRFRRAKPGSGVLPREIVEGPRLALPPHTGREYILFQADAQAFTDIAWRSDAPWGNDLIDPNSPSILWPADRAWFLATEIDYDSTLVGGSAELIHDIIATPGLEAMVLPEHPVLHEHGDRINTSPSSN